APTLAVALSPSPFPLPRCGEPALPHLEVHRLRERDPEARILAPGEREIGERGERRREQRGAQARRRLGLGRELDARRARPRGAGQQPAQREQVIVLSFVPHPVPPKPTRQVRQQTGLTLDCPLGHVQVLEPDGDGRQRGIVPRLTVRDPFVELADQVGRLVRHLSRTRRGGGVQPRRRAQQDRSREVVANPNGFEVRGEEQPARSEHVVPIGILPIAPRVSAENLGGPRTRPFVSPERRERGEMCRPLGEPQVLEPRPGAVVPLAGVRLATARAAVLVRAPRIEGECRAVCRADAAVGGEQSLLGRDGRHPLDHGRGALTQAGQQGRQIARAGDLRPARGEHLRGHHARTPVAAQRSGSMVAPASRAAATAGRTSSPATKNIAPPAPAPAALPPSAPASASARSSRAISGVRISGSSACWSRQFSPSHFPTRARSAARSASARAAANWSCLPPGIPASTVSRYHACSAISRSDGRSPRAPLSAATSATSSAPELPSPDPGGASERVVRVQALCTGNIRSAALTRSRRPSGTSPRESAHSSSWPRSSDTRRMSTPPSFRSTCAERPMQPFTTTPPSRAENGGTSVQPPAKSRRVGAVARNALGSSRRFTARRATG